MIQVALLRGINVGGKNKVEMARLRSTFESAGLERVQTYIASGNVIFADTSGLGDALAPKLEAAIAEEFGLDLKVLLRTKAQIEAVEEALPDWWVNDDTMKCDVMFLWQDVDAPDVLDGLTIKEEIDDVVYVPGSILWRVDRTHLTRSGMMRIVGSKLYRSMTVRNCNTVRKLAALMSEA